MSWPPDYMALVFGAMAGPYALLALQLPPRRHSLKVALAAVAGFLFFLALGTLLK